MARHNMPTAKAMSGRVCVEQYNNAPTSDMYSRWTERSSSRSALVERVASTCFGRSSEAGACWLTWKVEGTSSGVDAGGNVDIQQIRNGALIFYVPALGEILSEGVVERAGAVVSGQRDQVVDVATQHDPLSRATDVALGDKHARVGFTLLETPVTNPREETRTLPAAPGLRHSVHWFLDATDAGPAIGAVGRVARRSVTVYDFPGLELALKVGRHEIPSAHHHVLRRGQSGEDAERGGVHGGAECLVVVNALKLCTALHTEARLEGSVAFALKKPK
eukprot:3012436-Pleurochrysis_carterae.AAC.3